MHGGRPHSTLSYLPRPPRQGARCSLAHNPTGCPCPRAHPQPLAIARVRRSAADTSAWVSYTALPRSALAGTSNQLSTGDHRVTMSGNRRRFDRSRSRHRKCVMAQRQRTSRTEQQEGQSAPKRGTWNMAQRRSGSSARLATSALPRCIRVGQEPTTAGQDAWTLSDGNVFDQA